MPQLDILFNDTTLFWYFLNIILISLGLVFYLYLPFFYTLKIKIYYNSFIYNSIIQKFYSKFLTVYSLSHGLILSFFFKTLVNFNFKVNVVIPVVYRLRYFKDVIFIVNKYKYMKFVF